MTFVITLLSGTIVLAFMIYANIKKLNPGTEKANGEKSNQKPRRSKKESLPFGKWKESWRDLYKKGTLEELLTLTNQEFEGTKWEESVLSFQEEYLRIKNEEFTSAPLQDIDYKNLRKEIFKFLTKREKDEIQREKNRQ